MRIPTHVAAERLGLHPANMVLKLFPMVGSLDDCWPEMEDGLLDTLKELQSPARVPAMRPNQSVPAESQATAPSRTSELVSQSASRVLDKLERGDRWGGNAVSWETLHNHYCQNVSGLREAVDELLDADLLISRGGGSGPYSLNPAQKGAIEAIVAQRRRAP